MEHVEIISADKQTLCFIIRRTIHPDHTLFITPPDARQQVGFIVYPANTTIKRHRHKQFERHLVGMSEVLIVQKGHCTVDIYDDASNLVVTRFLELGDVIILTGGGHGFNILEDTVLLEIKQGPFLGTDDKELF